MPPQRSKYTGDWTLWIELWTRALRDTNVAKKREALDRRWQDTIADIVRAGQRSGHFDRGPTRSSSRSNGGPDGRPGRSRSSSTTRRSTPRRRHSLHRNGRTGACFEVPDELEAGFGNEKKERADKDVVGRRRGRRWHSTREIDGRGTGR